MYSHETELFEIELIICIKMDLPLITYKGWYAIKPNQPTILPMKDGLDANYTGLFILFYLLPGNKWQHLPQCTTVLLE